MTPTAIPMALALAWATVAAATAANPTRQARRTTLRRTNPRATRSTPDQAPTTRATTHAWPPGTDRTATSDGGSPTAPGTSAAHAPSGTTDTLPATATSGPLAASGAGPALPYGGRSSNTAATSTGDAPKASVASALAATGAIGTHGSSEASGTNGTTGTSGTSGTSEASGTSGASGASKASSAITGIAAIEATGATGEIGPSATTIAAGAGGPIAASGSRPGGAAWPSARVATSGGVIGAVGARLRQASGLLPPGGEPDAPADRLVGWAAVAGAVLLPLVPPLAPVPLLSALVRPVMAARAAERRRDAAVVDQVPDLVDLLALTTAAGLPVGVALAAIGDRPGGPAGAAVARARVHIERGGATAGALDHLAVLGPAARPLVDALAQHDRYGTPLLPALQRVAIETRARRRRRAEEAARSLPVTLLFPLVLTTLPAFVLLTVVPLLAGSLTALGT